MIEIASSAMPPRNDVVVWLAEYIHRCHCEPRVNGAWQSFRLWEPVKPVAVLHGCRRQLFESERLNARGNLLIVGADRLG